MSDREQVEVLAEALHDVYQEEAKRKADVRHPDPYSELTEEIKEYDRVIARYVLDLLRRERAELEAQVKALREAMDNARYSYDSGPVSREILRLALLDGRERQEET